MKSHNNITKTPCATRRTFLKTSSSLVTGLSLGTVLAAEKKETLALDGGPKAVTHVAPDAKKWPLYGELEEQAVLDLIRNPNYLPLDDLERQWRKFFDVDYAKAHCNGTGALTSMFFALDLPPGSEIMVPSYTFFATIVPMRLFGLVPVFVDINPRTLNFDLEDAKRRLTKNTRAILPVHWIGLPCDMDQICDWAEEEGLIVLEDACHAHGARLQGKFMGTWGRMAAYSFQQSKPLPAIEGGMGVYKNKEDYERAAAYGHHRRCFGSCAKYAGTGLAVKLRMHPLAAALASVQLQGLSDRIAAGVKQVRSLNDRILHLPGLYEQSSGRKDLQRLYYGCNMLFIEESEAGISRATAVKALRAEGVDTRESSYTLQHKLPIYREDRWWHQRPHIPHLPGSEKANRWGVAVAIFYIRTAGVSRPVRTGL